MGRIRFESFEIDVQALELIRGGQPVPLAPAAVRVLCVLAGRAGELVPREEIYEAIWPDGGVDRERLLNTYVRQIRAALGERSGDDRFIRTYPRRGYRFLPDVRLDGPPSAAPAVGRSARRGWRAGGALVAAALILALLLARPWASASAGPTPPASVAIEYRTAIALLDHPLPSIRARAAGHFERIVELEPDFAPGFTGLAQSLIWAGKVREAEAAARRAIALGPREARAHMTLGTALLVADWSWQEAEASLRTAVSLASDDPATHLSLAYLLVSSGRTEPARRHLDAARQLSPVAADITGDLGTLYGWLGDQGRALEMCRRTTLIEPRATWGYECALEAGRALGREDVVIESSEALARAAGADPRAIFAAADGVVDRVEALRELQLTRAAGGGSHFRRAALLAELGDADRALDELERAAAERELGFVALLGDPRLLPLRDDERFQTLISKLFPAGVPARAPLGTLD